jgi:CheY-like chemotaxis protein
MELPPLVQAPSPPDPWHFWVTAAVVIVGIVLLVKAARALINLIRGEMNPWSLVPASPSKLKALPNADMLSKLKEAFQGGPASLPETPAETPIAETVSPAPREAIADSPEVRNDPLKEFFGWVPGHLGMLRTLHQTISRTVVEGELAEKLRELRSHIGTLRSTAQQPELAPVRQLASALEGLVKQLSEDVRDVTPSTLRSVAISIDLLADLCTPALKADITTNPPIHILAVDDDPVSRIAITCSIKKAFDQPDLAEDGESALALAKAQPFDVIFLDVQMPGMDGFELCSKIHETDANRTTPVIFVTSMKDFGARAKSITSGGSDLIGKPFLSFEIAVKALTVVLRRRLPVSRPVDVAPASIPSVPPAPLPVVQQPVQIQTLDPVVAPEDAGRKSNELIDQDSREVQEQLKALHSQVQSMTRELNPEQFRPAFQMASALEALFRKLHEHPKNATPSTLFTAMSAMELVKDLSVAGVDPGLATNPPISILVVDDEPIARRAVVGALQMAFLKPENVGDGESALALAAGKKFDMIFLDVEMPGMDGYAACGKIHQTDLNQNTPVVFVTSHTALETRAHCLSCGGSDFVAKPILFVEIIVKALTYALRGRLQGEASLVVAK